MHLVTSMQLNIICVIMEYEAKKLSAMWFTACRPPRQWCLIHVHMLTDHILKKGNR